MMILVMVIILESSLRAILNYLRRWSSRKWKNLGGVGTESFATSGEDSRIVEATKSSRHVLEEKKKKKREKEIALKRVENKVCR